MAIAEMSAIADRTVEQQLQFREEVVVSAKKMEDPALEELATGVNLVTRVASIHAERINRPYFVLRTTLALIVIGVLAGLAYLVQQSGILSQQHNWRELLDVGAKVAQSLVAAPLVLSMLLLEGRLKRKRLLAELRTLEQLNDAVYQIQFNHSPATTTNGTALVAYLTCCCGLLFLIREAAGRYSENVSDAVVLERVANIRRGSNDNHRNILMKISMVLAAPASRV